MNWQSNELHAGALLNESMVEEITIYLEKKGYALANRLIQIINDIEKDNGVSSPKPFDTQTKINEAVEAWSKKLQQKKYLPTQSSLSIEEWNLASKNVNEAFWNYLEIIEDSMIELFQQVDRIGFENWNDVFARELTHVKDEFNRFIDDLSWALRRFAHQIRNYKPKKIGFFKKIKLYWQPFLDPKIDINIYKSQKFLNFQYGQIIDRYKNWASLQESVVTTFDGLSHRPIFSSMEISFQEKFKHLHLLLETWKQNRSVKALPKTEPVRALKSFAGSDQILALFNEYVDHIANAIFAKSRLIKKETHLFLDKQSKEPLLNNVLSYVDELHLLEDITESYQKFLAKTSSNQPFQKLKNYYFFWPKTESKHDKQFQKVIEEIKNLKTLCYSFQSSLENENFQPERESVGIKAQVEDQLHEMKQPLASQEFMKKHAKILLYKLKDSDEFGSTQHHIVNDFEDVLTQAILSDWRYHVLHSFPLFHQVYKIHYHVSDPLIDRNHLSRIHKFERVLDKLQRLVSSNEIFRYLHEIDLDLNDLKTYLQDFFAYVQRISQVETSSRASPQNESLIISQTKKAFLVYLYKYGCFFNKLECIDQERSMIQKQMLFVDQYFEAINRKIQEVAKDQLIQNEPPETNSD